jgi:methylated-DNA-[protein]-cysteine S-methyltransferase
MSPKTKFDLALDELMVPPTSEATTRAQAALRRRLQAVQPPTVWYDRVPGTPVGPLWVAVSEAGLAAVHYGADASAWLADLRRRGFGVGERSAEKTAGWRARLLAYLQGEKRALPAAVDWRGVTPFQRRVLEAAGSIPRGGVLTYHELAERLGQPRAARAVGQALRRNPMPIVLPCHRVVAANGDLRGYLGKHGVRTKAWLLQLEGARI